MPNMTIHKFDVPCLRNITNIRAFDFCKAKARTIVRVQHVGIRSGTKVRGIRMYDKATRSNIYTEKYCSY